MIVTDVLQWKECFTCEQPCILQLGVVPGAQQLLFVTWGCRIHQEQGLIVQATVCHLLNA